MIKVYQILIAYVGLHVNIQRGILHLPMEVKMSRFKFVPIEGHSCAHMVVFGEDISKVKPNKPPRKKRERRQKSEKKEAKKAGGRATSLAEYSKSPYYKQGKKLKYKKGKGPKNDEGKVFEVENHSIFGIRFKGVDGRIFQAEYFEPAP